MNPVIYADFQNADSMGRVRLNCAGTLVDLAKQRVQLLDGLRVTLRSDDLTPTGDPAELLVEGTLAYAEAERCWVSVIDWDAVRRVSAPAAHANGMPAAGAPVATTLDLPASLG